MTEKFIIGLVGSPFGVKGFVKIRPTSGEIDHLLKLKSVAVSKDGNERLLNIEESTPSHAGGAASVLMRFEGIASPEAAKTLNGAQLLAGRDQAAPLGDGEHYIEDLKGLEVFAEEFSQTSNRRFGREAEDAEGNKGEECEQYENIGTIVDIIEGGGGELVEIKLTNGEKRLVPFRKEFFVEISLERGRVLLQNLWILE